MASQRDVFQGPQRSSPSAASAPAPPPAQQEFLFVDAAKAKSSRQGRRNARSFVMQKARRERPWSTSKHAAKQRRSPETTSPATVGTPDLSQASNTSTPSPPVLYAGAQYFPFADGNKLSVNKLDTCTDCQIFQCRPGQSLCPRCLLLRPPAPAEDLDNSLFDPFGTSPVDMNASVTGLIEHCKWLPPCLLVADSGLDPAEWNAGRPHGWVLVSGRENEPVSHQSTCSPPHHDGTAPFGLDNPSTLLESDTNCALQSSTKWRPTPSQSMFETSPI